MNGTAPFTYFVVCDSPWHFPAMAHELHPHPQPAEAPFALLLTILLTAKNTTISTMDIIIASIT